MCSKQTRWKLEKVENTIIRSADKGSTEVVLDRGLYDKSVNYMLSNENVYCKLAYDPTNNVSANLDHLLQEGI